MAVLTPKVYSVIDQLQSLDDANKLENRKGKWGNRNNRMS